MWPTKTELHDATAHMHADTVLQILHGQALYWGYECRTNCNNHVPQFPFPTKEELERDAEKYKARTQEVTVKRFKRKWHKTIMVIAAKRNVTFEVAEADLMRVMGVVEE